MRAAMWIRLAAILDAIFLVGHLFGTLNLESADPDAGVLFDAMRGYRFDIMGASRTHWDFYIGLNGLLCVNLLVLCLMLWRLAALARHDPPRARPFMLILLLGFVAMAGLSARYFFLVPTLACALSALCLAIGLIRGRR